MPQQPKVNQLVGGKHSNGSFIAMAKHNVGSGIPKQQAANIGSKSNLNDLGIILNNMKPTSGVSQVVEGVYVRPMREVGSNPGSRVGS